MKYFLIALIAVSTGIYVGSHTDLFNRADHTNETSTSEAENEPLYWVAPMDKNYRRDKPGLSPMGMELVPVYKSSESEEGTVVISPAVENNLGVKTAAAKREQLRVPIKTVGTVAYDESQIRHIHSRVDGWIETLNIAAKGDKVSKGQVLFELYSPTLVNAQKEHLSTLRTNNSSLISGSKSRLMAFGLTENQVDTLTARRKVEQTVQFVAERDGVVIDLNVRQGMYIQPGIEIMSVGGLNSVWVLGEIFERQAHIVKRGQDVELTLRALPNRAIRGMVNYVYPELDSASRTMRIRVRVLNPDLALKPNMLAALNISTDLLEPSITVPRSALIKTANNTRVVKALGDGKFISQTVTPGLEGFGESLRVDSKGHEQRKVQILQGLGEGDLVVTSAQFLIDSESNIDAELTRLESGGEPELEATGASDSVIATREVIAIKDGMLTLNHDPIPEWDWPVMKMDFIVADDVDLTRLKPGQTITFEIEKTGDWDFVIRSIDGNPSKPSMRQRDLDPASMDHSAMDHSTMDHSIMDHSTMDHSTMDHSTMDHSTMDHSAMDHSAMDHSTMDHSTMVHSAMDHSTMNHSESGAGR